MLAAKAAAGGAWADLGDELATSRTNRPRQGNLGPHERLLPGLGRLDGAAIWREKPRESRAAQLAQWHRRGSISGSVDKLMLLTLTGAVTRLVPECPPDAQPWRDFGCLVTHLRDQKRAVATTRGKATRDASAAARRGALNRLLVCPPTQASDLDPIALGLGSWPLTAMLPHTCPATSTENSQQGSVTIVG